MKVLRKREVAERLGVSQMTLWRWEKASKFPRKVQLGAASVGYIQDEVDAWVRSRIEQRDA